MTDTTQAAAPTQAVEEKPEHKWSIEELEEQVKEARAEANELRRSAQERVVYTESCYSFNILLRHSQFKSNGQFTIRARAGEDGAAFMWRVKGMLHKCAEMGWTSPVEQPTSPPAFAEPQFAPEPAISLPSGLPPSIAPTAETDRGTEKCLMIEMGESYTNKNPQLIFHLEQGDPLRYTSKDLARFVTLLKEIGAFTVPMFVKGRKWTAACLVDWILSDPTSDGKRYRNVVAVRK